MNKKLIFALSCLVMFSLIETGCNKCTSGEKVETDSTSVETAKVEEPLPELKGDDKINQATRFYAGISRDGIVMPDSDSKSWNQYNNNLKPLLARSDKITQ